MPLPLPINAPPELAQWISTLAGHWDEQQRVRLLGMHSVAGSVTLRLLASAATTQVRVHQQVSDVYGAADVTQDIDCRVERQQDVTLAAANGRYVWLIPLWSDQGTLRAFDGVTGPDQMTPVDLLAEPAVHTHTEADITDLAHYTDADAAVVVAAGIASATLADLASADASQLDAGVLANARVQQSNITQHQAALALIATQITSGTLADARLSSNVPLKNAANDWSGINDLGGGVRLTQISDVNSKGEPDMQRYYGPGLSISNSSITGAFAIKVPSTFTMHALRVTLYEYASESGAVELLLGGYARGTGEGDWINTSAGGYGGYISGPDALGKYASVRFVYHSTYGNMILIGGPTTAWHYPKIFVEDLQGHNLNVAPTIGFFEAGVNPEPAWTHTTTDFVNRRGPVKDITTSTSTPTGDVPYGTLHLIY